jgi:hypothetical protein
MKPYPVLIEWHDAADFGEGWVSLDDVEDDHVAPCDVVSVGWFVRESESAVLLALSFAEDRQARQTFLVPTSAIKTMVRLRPCTT